MNPETRGEVSRRQFLKRTGFATGVAVAGGGAFGVHGGEEAGVRVALIGCGGRGSGAVADAMRGGERVLGGGGAVRLVAMADLRQDRLYGSYNTLRDAFGDRVDVPASRRYEGFDGYREAIDALRPGDVAMLATHAAFRPVHLEYAVKRGVNVFMEKQFAADPGGVRRVLAAGEVAERKGLKIAAGLMCRHSAARQALVQKIREGEMGEVELIRAYRMDPGYRMGPKPAGVNELMWQLSPGHPYQFMWASGGIFLELMIHQIDECFWIKDAWPESAHGVGGRYAGSTDCSQNLDSYAVEYTFPDGTKAQVTGRYIPNCHNDFATFVHGSKCAAKFSGDIHAPDSWMYRGQRVASSEVAWRAPREEVSPWQAEWEVLLRAIREDRPHNEARRAALSNLGAMMGRAAVHMGTVVTWEQAMASDFAFYGDVDGLTPSSPAPAQADGEGRYEAPVPGVWREV